MLLVWGQSLFNLPYDKETPFFVTKEWNEEHPDSQMPLGATNKTVVFTMMFQTFVFLQCFNQLNSRTIEAKEMNVFKNLLGNWIFLFIFFITFAVQIFITEVGGQATRTTPLTGSQNVWCLLIAAGCVIWSVIVKEFMAPQWFEGLVPKSDSRTAAKYEKAGSLLRKSTTMRRSTKKGADVDAE